MSNQAKGVLLLLIVAVVATAVLLEEEARRRRQKEPRVVLPELVLVDWMGPQTSAPPPELKSTETLIPPPAARPVGSARSAVAGSAARLGPGTSTYQVQAGDSFYKIAAQVYGNGNLWKRIWEANKAQVPEPSALREGLILRIPPAQPKPAVAGIATSASR